MAKGLFHMSDQMVNRADKCLDAFHIYRASLSLLTLTQSHDWLGSQQQ